MIGNFTEGKTLQVNEEASSDFESAFGLEKIPIRAKRQNYLNETKGKTVCLISRYRCRYGF